MFQKRLEETCKKINSVYAGNIYADFKILKGIDEIAGVLSTMSKSYEIITTILEQLHPNLMRFVLVLGYVETSIETMDVARMDGPAFHKASDIMGTLKKSKLMFEMSVGDKVVDTAIAGEINLILLLKKNWSAKQHWIVMEYEKTKNQYEIAKNLGITQQAVSKTLNRSMWKEIRSIEEKLNDILDDYTQRQHTGGCVG
jgi:predicted XRE-type DNA-binding protein